MPYKSPEKQREAVRKAVKRYREGITENKECNTLNVIPDVEMFEGKPRYLVLSDGQVLDRVNQPVPNKHLPGMAACNRANETDLSRGMSKQERLARLLSSLDKETVGLDGKRVNLQTMVRYGIGGPTFKEVADKLT